MTRRIDELVQSICGTEGGPLAPLLRGLASESRQFLAFAEAHASKIRKKARLAPLDDELGGLLAELAVAAFLLRDRRFSLLYEPQVASAQRGPDFQAIFKTHTPFHIEVTRLRLLDPSEVAQAGAALKLARVVCDKLGQLPAGAMNVVVVVVPPGAEIEALAPAATRLLESAAQRETSALPSELRAEELQLYQRQRLRLSAIALCSLSGEGRPQALKLWLNPQARHRLHPDIARYLAQTS